MELLGDGHLHGQVSPDFSISGEEIAYIYPDGETVLKGKFQDKFMKKAFAHEVEKYDCDETGMLFVKNYSQRKSEDVYFYDPPTNTSFGGGSKNIPDPYEIKMVKQDKSAIPNSGDGVFALKNLPKHRLVAFYSGIEIQFFGHEVNLLFCFRFPLQS